ncbi:unnamed protein product, partial [Meganyctiphanes norvegica]
MVLSLTAAVPCRPHCRYPPRRTYRRYHRHRYHLHTTCTNLNAATTARHTRYMIMRTLRDTRWRRTATVLLVSTLATHLHQAWCDRRIPQQPNIREKEKNILDELFKASRYDKRIRPSGINGTADGPTIVMINMMFRSIQTIDDVNMEYSVQLTFREEWTDERLVFDDLGGLIKYLTLTETNKVWMPDLFFKNEKVGHFHDIILPNVYLRISPNGGVLYSIRISLTLSCPMNLQLYPLDTQKCELLLAS